MAFGPLYSKKDCIGMVIGTGSVGYYLPSSNSISNLLNTYLSVDGGYTWNEIAKGSNVYDFTNKGSLIVLSKNINPTNSISYSWDQGLTW